MHFKLKKTVNNDKLPKEFSVTLYPNSAFLIPLSTNRLYTHEIKPSTLNVEKIPVRMGYVVRCSNVEAKYMENETYIKDNGVFIKLEPMSLNSIENLKNSYFEENNNLNNLPISKFNNALIEIYDSQYAKMKYHSDQNLDLDDNSIIGVFSCYEFPDEITEENIRKLKIKDKTSHETFEMPLSQNSVILFSTKTNMKYQHKIVLDTEIKSKKPILENKWLGITFRTSKTFIEFKNEKPYFSNGEPLKLANEAEEKAFFMHRSMEKKSLNFNYPLLNYTISVADMLKPKMTSVDLK